MAAASRPVSMRWNTPEVVALGAGEILLTSMDRDGTRSGFDIALTRAGGGCGTRAGDRVRRGRHAAHLVDGIREGRATAVLAASIFHFGQYSVSEAKQFMAKAGLPVRLDA